MNKYNEIITVNPIFQNSVNIEYDLGDESKIREYIPTTEACVILKKYLSSCVSSKSSKIDRNSRATSLIGPYGKGKSFLILVLLYILSADRSSEVYIELKARIGKVDSELHDLMSAMDQRNFRLLPVVVNSDYDDLSQAFTLGLNEALVSSGLQSLVPNTAYKVALELLGKWNEDPEFNKKVVRVCEEQVGVKIGDVRKGLKKHSRDAYQQFSELYHCVTRGLPFNPMIKDNIVQTIDDVAHSVKEVGYSGLFFVFDEFSKFIESGISSMSRELKLLQDIFEYAVRSKDNSQVHLTCITHKALAEYKKGLDEISVNAFATIEGRVKEIRFNRKIGENYQMISYALAKKPGFEEVAQEFIDSHSDMYAYLRSEGFVEADQESILFKDCFPFNPFAVYALIQLSEMVAQNERTLFTFISDNDKSSLNTFINNTNAGLFNVDSVYDYFQPLFAKEESNDVRVICYRCEATMRHVFDRDEKRILKALAIFSMLSDVDHLPATTESLGYASGLSKEESEKVVSSLIRQKLLRRNILTNYLSFASTNSKEIDTAVDRYLASNADCIDICYQIENTAEDHFILPRKYNTQRKMTRYYSSVFMKDSAFLKLRRLSSLITDADGLVINIVRTDLSVSLESLCEKYAEIYDDERVIVRFPESIIDKDELQLIKVHAALDAIIESSEDKDIIIDEMAIIRDEYRSDIQKCINNIYKDNVVNLAYGAVSEIPFKTLVSSIFLDVYAKAPLVNNELLNRHDVGAQYQKARNNIVSSILDGRELDYKPTSPEMTIYNSIFRDSESNGIDSIVIFIKNHILLAEGCKKSLSSIVDILLDKPYGIREGLLPVLFAKAIADLGSHFILYMQRKEIALTAANLNASLKSPEKYKFSLKKGSIAQDEYLISFIELFGGHKKESFRENLSIAVEAAKRFCFILPAVVRDSKLDRNLAGISEEAIRFKNEFLSFDINPYDVIMNIIPNIFCEDKKALDYGVVLDALSGIKSELVNGLMLVTASLVSEIKAVFDGHSDESLMSVIKQFKSKNGISDSVGGLTHKSREIGNKLFSEALGYDDAAIADDLSRICTGSYISDWTMPDKKTNLFKSLADFKEEVLANTETVSDSTEDVSDVLQKYADKEISTMGRIMKRGFDSIFDEFGDSVTFEDKMAILASYMKELLE